jgi:hypothetical protein
LLSFFQIARIKWKKNFIRESLILEKFPKFLERMRECENILFHQEIEKISLISWFFSIRFFFQAHSEAVLERSFENVSQYTPSTGTPHQATVVSEVQATYEIIKRIPEARQPQPAVTQEQTVRKASSTMTYSKSFHLPRRPSADSTPTPIVASPRLSRYNFSSGQGPPPVPPKLFNAGTDEFKNVFSKFRKHVEPDSATLSIAPSWQESSSSATSTTPFTVTSTFPSKATLSTKHTGSDAHDTNE